MVRRYHRTRVRGGRGGEIGVLNTGIQDVENSTKVRGGRGGILVYRILEYRMLKTAPR